MDAENCRLIGMFISSEAKVVLMETISRFGTVSSRGVADIATRPRIQNLTAVLFRSNRRNRGHDMNGFCNQRVQ